MPDGMLVPPLTHHKPSVNLEDGYEGASQTIRFTARQWASPSVKEQENAPVKTSRTIHSPQAVQILSAPPKPLNFQACACGAEPQPLELDMFLNRLKTHRFSISCMVFQDVWNVDLERVRDCCIHILSPDDRLIPFCMYNLTNARGKSLYRSQNQ